MKKELKGLLHENRRIFAPFRALGFVTNHVPFAIQVRTYKGATTAPRVHILTCLGRAWAELEGEKMRLLFVGGFFFTAFLDRESNISQSTGPDANEPISALSLHGNYVWATAGPNVLQYETGKQVSCLTPLPFRSSLPRRLPCSRILKIPHYLPYSISAITFWPSLKTVITSMSGMSRLEISIHRLCSMMDLLQQVLSIPPLC